MNPVVGLDVSKGESQVEHFQIKVDLIVRALVSIILLKD